MEDCRVFTSFNNFITFNRNVIENLTVRERPIGSDHRNIPRNSRRSVRPLPCMNDKIRLAHRLSENHALAICTAVVLFYYHKSGNFQYFRSQWQPQKLVRTNEVRGRSYEKILHEN